MRAAIIDDRPDLRDNLKTLLSIYAPDIEIVGEADGVKTGFSLLQELTPELLFLDVEMGDGTGFDLLAMMKGRDMNVVFVTGHDKYAINAFRFSALDYILKPIDPDDLMRAVEKARATSGLDAGLQVANLLQNHESKQPKRLVLKDATNTYLIQTEEVVHCEADVNYTRFYLKDKRKILVSHTLKSYAEMLEPLGFFRCHQSHLINLSFFDRYDKSEGGGIYLKTGEMIPVSVRKRDELMKALASF